MTAGPTHFHFGEFEAALNACVRQNKNRNGYMYVHACSTAAKEGHPVDAIIKILLRNDVTRNTYMDA